MNMRLAAGVLAVIFAISLTFLLAIQEGNGITGASVINNDISIKLAEKGIPASNLELRRADKDAEFRYQFYDQYYNGIPVYGGKIGFIYKNNELIYENDNFYKDINVNTKPLVMEKSAKKIAGMQVKDNTELQASLVILPHGRYYYLAYEVVYPEKTIFVDAVKGGVLYELSNIIYDDVYGNVSGLITPEKPSDVKVSMQLKNLNITFNNGTISLETTTNATGFYNVSISGTVTVNSSLAGPYVKVVNADQAPANHVVDVTSPTEHSWNWQDNDTSADYEESNVFYHINKVHDFFTAGDPFNITAMNYQMIATVEYDNNYCNAFYSMTDNSTRFGNSSTCGNLALMSDVIYHEYTHGVVDHIYDLAYNCDVATAESSAMHEGFADYFAATINNNSCAAEEFAGQDCLRQLNNTYIYPDSWVNECHDDSRIFSGAMWDLRGYTNATFTDTLVMRGIKAETQNLTAFLDAIISLNDNNTNLTDGTPEISEICDAFANNHGIFSNYCAGFTTETIAQITTPLADAIIARDSSYDVNGTAYNAEGASFTNYTVSIKPSSGSTWTLMGNETTVVSNSKLATLNTTGLTRGNYDLKLEVIDSSMTKTLTKSFSITDAAIYCTTSPCIASSNLIKSRDSIAGTVEPNQPNTIDACLDGTGQETGGYLHDESLENITVTSDIGKFKPGSNVTVNIWGYCYDGVILGAIITDYMKIIYSNSSDPDELNWRIISGGNCTVGGVFQNFSATFTLDNKEGNHSIRGTMQNLLIGDDISETCGSGAYADADDVMFYVTDMPYITGSTPANGTQLSSGTTSTTITITTDEQAICRYSTSDESYASMDAMDTTNSITHTVAVTGLQDEHTYDYYFRCNDSSGNTMTSSYYLTFSVKKASSSNNGGGGGGDGTTIIETYDISPGESKVIELSVGGGSIAYNTDSETHTIKLSGVIGDSAELTITSSPIKVLLKVGETKAVDVNDNGQNDLELTLLSLIGNSVKLRLKLLAETIAPVAEAETANETAEANLAAPSARAAPEAQPAMERNKVFLISILIVTAVITWVAINQFTKARKRKKGWELIDED